MVKLMIPLLMALTCVVNAPIDVSAAGESPFSFIVFGDLNGGGCEKNNRVNRLVSRMSQTDAGFFLQTGDLVDGYGTTSCFASEHTESPCTGAENSGNIRAQLLPLISKEPPVGLQASFFPTLGNHDTGGSWYPDPCGDGICDLLNMDSDQIRSTYLVKDDVLNVDGFSQHTLNHGDICDKADSLAYKRDFYYSFTYQNSYFIVLNQHEDYSGMLSCNGGHPGYGSCADYCSDESLYLNSSRNNNCYSIAQYDWLVTELQKANIENYEHIFVFAHAPLLTSSWNHAATNGAAQIRTLLEEHNVDVFFNGHNHAYERTHAVLGDSIDDIGTVYITVGSGGALTDGINGAWFTAADYRSWSAYNDQERMTTYLLVHVDGASVSGEVISLGAGDTPVDQFSVTAIPCENPDNDIHVMLTGDDTTGDGTYCNPYETIQKGIDDLAAGRTLIIHEGVHAVDPIVRINSIGTEADPITIRGLNTTIDGSGTPNSMSGGSTFFVDHAQWIIIEDLTFINSSYNSIRVSWSPHVVIRNIVSDGAYMHGVFTDYSEDFTLEHSTLTNTLHSHGAYVSNSADRPIVRNNIFSNNHDAGFQINADPLDRYCVDEGCTWGADSICDGIISGAIVENNILFNNTHEDGSELNFASIRDSIIRNNLIYKGNLAGISAWGDGNGPEWGSKNNVFIHNIVYLEPGSGRAPFSLKEGSTGNIIANNIFISGRNSQFNYGALELDSTSVSQTMIDNNIYYRYGTEHVVTIEDIAEYTLDEWRALHGSYDANSYTIADPADLFIDITADNFHPPETSISIDNGYNSSLGYDIENTPRPQGYGYDIGAYEYDSEDPEPGDVNGDGIVDLADAIVALQISAGISPAQNINIEADVNGDGNIGPEEVLFIVEALSGMR